MVSLYLEIILNIIVQIYHVCLEKNVFVSCSVDVFANFASISATWLVAMRSTISNSIPD